MSDLNREYKSTIFTMLFSDKEKLKSLCEAVRMLFYYADLLRADHPVRELYQNPAIDLDTPRFVVFYNGDDKANDFDRKELRLSEHFVRKSENPDAEIRVMVYNVNEGHNRELMDACNTLKEYSTFVALSKKALKGIRDQREKVQAMKRVLDECLERDILVDFIQAHREVIVMRSIWEYDEQAHYEALREDGYDAGKKDGLREGKDTVFQILDRLKSGKSAESLIAEGMDPEIVQMASKYL